MIIETWFISVLIATLLIWVAGFINKVIVEEKYDRNISILTVFITTFVISIGMLLFSDVQKISLWVLAYWIFWGVADYALFKARFISLTWISSSLFFINQRLFSSSVLLVVGIFLFWDIVTIYELLWFITGFIVFWLLFEKEKVKNADYKRGIIYLIVCIFLAIFIHAGFKFTTDIIYSLSWFLFHFWILICSYSITWFLLTYIKNFSKLSLNINNLRKVIILNICYWILWFIYIIFIMKAYSLSDLWIVYKIQSYALFIPIFLSILFYDEQLTPKKIIAFILTMISLWFFI